MRMDLLPCGVDVRIVFHPKNLFIELPVPDEFPEIDVSLFNLTFLTPEFSRLEGGEMNSAFFLLVLSYQ